MFKPNSLRDHLLGALSELRTDPDKLLIYVEEGGIVARGISSYSFEYQYKLTLIITDFSGDSDAIMVPLLAWVHIHQRELLDNPDKREKGVRFQVDFNSRDSVDIEITLDITEAVRVAETEPGALDITRIGEPQIPDTFEEPGKTWQLRKDGHMLAQWPTPKADP